MRRRKMSNEKNNQTINILTHDTVRNPNITSNDFVLILYIQYMVWQRKSYSFDILSDECKMWTSLSDKTLNKSFTNLHRENYLLKKVEKRLPNKPIELQVNKNRFDIKDRRDGEFFTQLPIRIMYALKEMRVTPKQVRLLYYIQSYIVFNSANNFCFVGLERMEKEVKMSRPTLIKTIKELTEMKLITVTKHNVGTSYQYNENDELIYTKFNNHYTVEYSDLLEF